VNEKDAALNHRLLEDNKKEAWRKNMGKAKNEQQQKIRISVGGNIDGNIHVDDHHTESDSSISHVTAGGDVKIATGGSAITDGGPENTAAQMSVEEVLQLFRDILTEVDHLETDEESKRAAKKHLKHAVIEIEDEEEPDKNEIAEFLKKSTEVLKEAGGTALQAVSFGKLVGTAALWLGKNLVWFGL
jgi:protein-tyrosine phosphatase